MVAMPRYFDDVFLQVNNLVSRMGKTPLLIGIDGLGGAGKSTLAQEIVERFDCSAVVVEGDDFYRDLNEMDRANLDPEQGFNRYFDWQRLKKEVLFPARAGAAVLRYQRYDWDAGRMGTWVEIAMPEIVIVEGIYTLRQQLRDLIDVKIYVESPRQVRLQRQHDRGQNSHQWISRWSAAEDFYVSQYEPRSVADLVINGN